MWTRLTVRGNSEQVDTGAIAAKGDWERMILSPWDGV